MNATARASLIAAAAIAAACWAVPALLVGAVPPDAGMFAIMALSIRKHVMARKQYPLRIDPAIWEAVQRWADDEMRSAHGQVEWILRDALKRAGRLPKKEGRSKGDEK